MLSNETLHLMLARCRFKSVWEVYPSNAMLMMEELCELMMKELWNKRGIAICFRSALILNTSFFTKMYLLSHMTKIGNEKPCFSISSYIK